MAFTLDLSLPISLPTHDYVLEKDCGQVKWHASSEFCLLLDGVVFGINSQSIFNKIVGGNPDIVNQIDGLFVAVVMDARQGTVTLTRDPLGRRSLFYYRNNEQLIISNRPNAFPLNANPSRTRLASYLGQVDHPDQETFLEKVTEVAAGTTVTISRDGIHSRRNRILDNDLYSRLDATTQIQELDRLMKQSFDNIHQAFRPKKMGIMLSGGMDSPTVAAYAREFGTLTAFSWTFEDPKIDESFEIQETAKYLGLPLIKIDGNFASLNNHELTAPHPFTPDMHSFVEIKQRLYHRASQEGVDLLLNGVWGDELFRPLFKSRLLSRRKLRQWRARFRQSNWLTTNAKKSLQSVNYKPFRRPDQAQANLGSRASQNDSWENLFLPHAFPLVSPLRDRSLVEFALSVPKTLPSHGYSKPLLRTLMANRLPDSVTKRTRRTTLEPWFDDRIQFSKGSMARRISQFRKALQPWIKSRLLDEWCKGDLRQEHGFAFWISHAYVYWIENHQKAGTWCGAKTQFP